MIMMGALDISMSTYSRFYFRPARGEQTEVTLSPAADERAAILGRVIDAKGAAVDGALVLLFSTGEDEPPALIARSCTDEDGHFIFGPIEPERLYLIKVFKNEVKLRELEIST